jgi:flagellar hook assembly protein FlgD
MGPPIPNPASGQAAWQLDLPRPTHVRLTICDLNGRIVASAVDGPLATGSHRLTWDGKLSGGGSAARGVYFYRLEAEGKLAEGKLVWTRGK